MRLYVILAALAIGIISGNASWSQTPAPPDCNEQLQIMRNYLTTVAAARDNAEVQLAVERQKVAMLEAAAKPAAKK